MFYLITVFAFSLTAADASSNNKLHPTFFASYNERIVGGKDAKIEDYPYMAALEKGGIFCGATIVAQRHVVTAAHCLENYPNVKNLLVRVGTSIRDSGGQTVRIRQYSLHPKYSPDSADYDVGVVELEDALVFSPTVQTVLLQDKNREPPVGSYANVTGWGYTSPENLPLILQVIEVPRLSQEECVEIWRVTPRMMCFGYEQGGRDACGGDSGGPLVANGKLVGIVSFGGKCAAPRQPGGYTNIANEEIYNYIKRSIINL